LSVNDLVKKGLGHRYLRSVLSLLSKDPL
jgi:hypothetical protein